MFFPFYMLCCGSKQTARKTYQEHKLTYLKSVKDSLETQLASVSAAIETIEGQLQQDSVSATE
ncbi:MAG: hypothetical protein AAF152_00820 [Cyanobacteria bacterium P01_A01_bin.114]